MTRPSLNQLSRRERQMMNVIYRLGRASVKDVQDGMSDPPGYSAVRATLRLLEEKGYLEHEQDGARYLYRPTVPRAAARRSALANLMATFFDGSAEQVVATLVSETELSDDELERLSELIERARREER